MNLAISRSDHGGGRAFRRAATVPALAAAACAALCCGACSSVGASRVTDRLDPVTGNTVVVLDAPAELVTAQSRGPSRDPYAFAAPFDVDRMGDRELYLWVSVPQDRGTPMHLQVLCDGRPLDLTEARRDLDRLQLSRAPYAPTAPWSGERYFRMPATALTCLAGAQRMAITFATQDEAAAHEERFVADAAALRGFAAFAAHLRAP